MSTAQTKLWWRRNSAQQSLATELDSLIERLGTDQIKWSYLEWRPGSNLGDQRRAPILIKGAPEHESGIELDEVRLFTAAGGIYAVEDAGTTRWMQWRSKRPESSDENSPWEIESVSIEPENDIFMLKKEAANRFGLSQDDLPEMEEMKVVEYRRNGGLFCWNLTEENRSD